jgi:queuosine precursor transporter
LERFEAAIDTDGRRLAEGLLFLVLYCLTIPAADYLTTHIGYICEPDGPCKVPIAPGIMSTSGAFAIGFTFVLRDFIQRRFGVAVSACAVVMGAALAGFLAPPALVVASGTGIFVAGFMDLAVYTLLARKNFVAAVAASSVISSAVDSAIFLWLAFSSLDLLAGQTLAKTWVIFALLPLTWWLWKRDMRIGLAAA